MSARSWGGVNDGLWIVRFARGGLRAAFRQPRSCSLSRRNGCASCHGPEGHGDGPLAPHLPASPIDFRDVSLFKRGASGDAIAKTLRGGNIDNAYLASVASDPSRTFDAQVRSFAKNRTALDSPSRDFTAC